MYIFCNKNDFVKYLSLKIAVNTLLGLSMLLLTDNQPHKRLDIYEKLALQFSLTEEEKEQLLPSGKQQIYKNRIGWALT